MEIDEVLPDGTVERLGAAVPQPPPPPQKRKESEAKIMLLEYRRPAARVPRPLQLQMPIELPVPIQVALPRGALGQRLNSTGTHGYPARWRAIDARGAISEMEADTMADARSTSGLSSSTASAAAEAFRGADPPTPSKRRRPGGDACNDACGELEDLTSSLGDIQVESPAKRPALAVETVEVPSASGAQALPPPPPPSPVSGRVPPPRFFNAKRKIERDGSALPSCMEAGFESAFLQSERPPTTTRTHAKRLDRRAGGAR